jgi:dipeptidase E
MLAGGGGADDSRPLDQVFASWVGPHATILYLPIAMMVPGRNFTAAREWLTQAFAPFGLTNISMWTDVSDKTASNLTSFDAVYIGGGNTFWLLHQLRAHRLDAALTDFIRQGYPVYGGSAGAIILGRDIQTCAHMDQNTIGLTDTHGLDVLHGYAVWRHYHSDDDERIAALAARAGIPVLALSERAGVYLEGNHFTATGFEPTIHFTGTDRTMIAVGGHIEISEQHKILEVSQRARATKSTARQAGR